MKAGSFPVTASSPGVEGEGVADGTEGVGEPVARVGSGSAPVNWSAGVPGSDGWGVACGGMAARASSSPPPFSATTQTGGRAAVASVVTEEPLLAAGSAEGGVPGLARSTLVFAAIFLEALGATSGFEPVAWES